MENTHTRMSMTTTKSTLPPNKRVAAQKKFCDDEDKLAASALVNAASIIDAANMTDVDATENVLDETNAFFFSGSRHKKHVKAELIPPQLQLELQHEAKFISGYEAIFDGLRENEIITHRFGTDGCTITSNRSRMFGIPVGDSKKWIPSHKLVKYLEGAIFDGMQRSTLPKDISLVPSMLFIDDKAWPKLQMRLVSTTYTEAHYLTGEPIQYRTPPFQVMVGSVAHTRPNPFESSGYLTVYVSLESVKYWMNRLGTSFGMTLIPGTTHFDFFRPDIYSSTK
jgi:hypothetical protein